jgi:hypothetical protein
VLTETTNPMHMRDNLSAAFGRIPDETMRARMLDVAKALP